MGDWGDVLRELPQRVGDWMERPGAARASRWRDLVFAGIGPALEIFSRCTRSKLPRRPGVTLPEYLEKVWEVVGRTALEQVLGSGEGPGQWNRWGFAGRGRPDRTVPLDTAKHPTARGMTANGQSMPKRPMTWTRTRRRIHGGARPSSAWSSTSSGASPSRWVSTCQPGKTALSRP